MHTKNINRFLMMLLLPFWVSCGRLPHDSLGRAGSCSCDTSVDSTIYNRVRGALLGSRFKSLEELKSVIQIEYFNDNADTDNIIHKNSMVCVKDCSNGKEMISVLA